MKTLAAVLVDTARPLELLELELPPLKAGQVMVEVAFSGVCHTQVLESRGHRGEDRYLPHCLGHEGSGIVREIGPGVSKVKVGDPVILSWIQGKGMDAGGSVYGWNGRAVNAGGVTTFQRHAVASENRVTPAPAGVSLSQAALVGCAVPTGMGAVIHAGSLRAGQSIVVFGVGGVGLCAIAAARLSGGCPIIAVDLRKEKLDVALRLGATHVISAAEADPVREVLRICPKGVDVAIEASGAPVAMAQAMQSCRAQGGSAVIVGNARHGQRLEIDPWQLNLGKRILGTWGGDSVPDRDYPGYCRLMAEGRLALEPLITRTYPLERINQALGDLADGSVIRPLVDLSTSG